MADEYISREAALRAIENKRNEYVDKAWTPVVGGRYRQDELFANAALGCRAAEEEVKTVPAADVKPVVYGYWTRKRTIEHDGELYCSVCGKEPNTGMFGITKTNFCPNCGADMREVEHEL